MGKFSAAYFCLQLIKDNSIIGQHRLEGTLGGL